MQVALWQIVKEVVEEKMKKETFLFLDIKIIMVAFVKLATCTNHTYKKISCSFLVFMFLNGSC